MLCVLANIGWDAACIMFVSELTYGGMLPQVACIMLCVLANIWWAAASGSLHNALCLS